MSAIEAKANTVDTPKEVEQALTEAPIASEEVAQTSVLEPLKDAVNPQPTTTHTESGTEHAPADPVVAAEMSTSDTPAEVSTEATPATEVSATVATGDAEPTPADKPVAKEKTEKVKAEGKGFFAKLFGSKEKKEKKVKTPKTEAADPIATTGQPEASAPVTETLERSESAAAAAPEVSADTAPAVVVVEAVAPTSEATAAEVEPAEEVPATDAAPATPAKDASPKAPKATRRLSARISSAFNFKNFGKVSPHVEKSKDEVETVAEEAPGSAAVSAEAPQLEKPVETEPIKLEDKPEESAASTSAPPAAPVVAETA